MAVRLVGFNLWPRFQVSRRAQTFIISVFHSIRITIGEPDCASGRFVCLGTTRRRLEVSGGPLNLPMRRFADHQIRHLSVADILRSGRRRVVALTEHPPGSARLTERFCDASS
jgi:hypothetical protein